MVGQPNGTVAYLPAKGASQGSLLNRKGVHFSKIPNTFTWIMNLDVFNSLPAHLQDVLVQVAADYDPIMMQYMLDYKAKERKVFEDAGVQYVTFSPKDAEWWIDNGYEYSWLEVKERTHISPESWEFLRDLLRQ